MTAAFTIAPVRKSILVNAPQAHAFEVFTAGIDRWWPKTFGIGKTPVKTAIIEPRAGGRWHMIYEDGADITTGVFSVWEAPERIVFSWDISADWTPDTRVASEVEVRFIAEGPSATRVELEHRKFEALGAEGGARMRAGVDGGWPGLMELFKAAAEGRS